MKNKISILILYTFVSFIFTTICASSAIQNNTNNASVNEPDYISEAYADSGKIIRWNKKTIYINILENSHTEEIVSAFSKWQNALSEEVTFKYISNLSGADIVVDNGYPKKYNYALTKNYYKNSQMIYSTIFLPINCYLENNKEIYPVILHEIGHSLGILSHSSNKENIMFFSPNQNLKQLSSYDIATIKKIYSLPSGSEVSNAQGNKIELFDDNITLLSKANFLKKNDKIDQAILEYKKILKNDKTIDSANYNLGLCYIKKNNYKKGYKYIAKAIKSDPKNIVYIHGFVKIGCKIKKIEEPRRYLFEYINTTNESEYNPIIHSALIMLSEHE